MIAIVAELFMNIERNMATKYTAARMACVPPARVSATTTEASDSEADDVAHVLSPELSLLNPEVHDLVFRFLPHFAVIYEVLSVVIKQSFSSDCSAGCR